MVVVTSSITELVVRDVDDAVGGAVCRGSESGCVIGAGASEIRECAACDVDIGYNEIGRSF